MYPAASIYFNHINTLSDFQKLDLSQLNLNYLVLLLLAYLNTFIYFKHINTDSKVQKFNPAETLFNLEYFLQAFEI